ncbi:MAG: YceI family protein [Flavobacteriaceae bacterium]
MKTLTIFIVLLISTTISAQEYNVDKKQSKLNWTGKAAFNAYKLNGKLSLEKGVLIIEDNQIKQLTVLIDMKSLDHSIGDLKKHLRSKDFFEVKKYPTATFTLTKPIEIIEGNVTLTGTMKIKKTTREETIIARISKENNAYTITFDTKLDRTKYGVKFNSPSFFKKMKENAIADKFSLKGEFLFQ